MSTEERKVPELRFKGFNDDWEQRELNDLVEFSKGKFYSKSDLVENGNDVILYGQLYTNYQTEISYSDTKVIPKPNSVYSKGKEVIIPSSGESAEDISIASSLTVGGIIIAGDINILTPFNILNNTFLALDLSNGKSKKELSKYAQGKSIVHLHGNDFKKLKLKFPILNEQIKIKEFILRIEILINLHQRKFNILKKLKKVYLKEMFADHVNKRPNLRFKDFEEEWELRKLGELGSTFTGLQGKSKVDFGHGSANYVPYTNIFNNLFVDTNQLEKIEQDSKQNSLKYGDVLFTTSSETPVEVGMSSIWLGKMSNVYLNSFCFGYRLNTPINLYFLAFSLRSPYFRRRMSVLAQGISRYNISKTKVMDSLISVPETTEQKYIGEFLVGLEKAIEFQNSKIKKIKELKKEYLNKMFI